MPNGAIGGFVKASVLLEKEDTISGGAVSARIGLVAGGREEIGGYSGVNGLGDPGSDRPVAGSAAKPSVKKLGAPRRRVGGKKTAVLTVEDGGDEDTTGARATVPQKTKAPCKNAVAAGKKLSSTLVTKEDDEDIIPCEPAPVKKQKVSRKKAIAVAEEIGAPFAQDQGQDTIKAKPVPTKKLRASRKKAIAADIQPAESTVLEGGAEASKTVEVAPVKMSRAKKSKDDGQTKLTKGKIVKPSTGENHGESTKTKRASRKRKSDPEDDSDHLRAGETPRTNGPPEPLGLDKATTRRRDWTPVEDCNNETVDELTALGGVEFRFSNIDLTVDIPAANNLGAHLSNYGYEKIPETALLNIQACNVDSQAPTKRRKLDLIDTPNYPPPEANGVKRSKSVRKKPQTITEKATAPFLPEKPHAASPLLQYLTQSNSQPGHPVQAGGAQPAKQSVKAPGHKSTARVTKSRASKANAGKPAPILLSPEEAMKGVKDQVLLFGTSSQLVCGDSPTFVRDLQQAIKESESFHVLPDTPIGGATDEAHSTGSTILRRQLSRNLWSEAARDSQGSLLEPEVIDLLDTPIPRESSRNSVAFTSLLDVNKVTKPLIEDTSWKAIDDVQRPLLETTTEARIAKPVIPETTAVTHDVLHPLPRCVAETALRPRPKSRSPEKKKKKKKLSSEQEDTTSQMPNYRGFTMNHLSVAISKYGFKPIKGKDAMITLLEKCWESKARLALQSLPPNVNVPSLAPPSDQTTTERAKTISPAKRKGRPPKVKDGSTVVEGASKTSTSPTKPRGRPKKSTLPPATTLTNGPEGVVQAPTTPPKSKAKRKAIPGDIEDPHPPPSPSPPRRQFPLSPPQVVPLIGPPKPSTGSTPSLFAKITEAITSLPPSNDPQDLTWHEMILLYDPIVLEDLAAWLNTKGLGRVGVDEEVGAEVVKEWCEGRSVCCLWRQGRNGKRGEAAGKG